MDRPAPRPRIRVLLIAEACNPSWSSVPLVGWHHSRAIAGLADVHLVTHVRNRADLVQAGLAEGADFTALDTQRVEAPLAGVGRLLGAGLRANKGWTTLTALSTLAYYYFERLVWRTFATRLLRGDFDVVHRLTPLSPATPSLMARRCRRTGVPFVVGPLNGGLSWPSGFSHVRLAEREWLGFVRGAHRLLPGYASTRADASAIIVGSCNAWSQIPARHRSKTVYIPENGIDPGLCRRESEGPVVLPLRVAYAGRLVPTKGVDMLLEAAAPLLRQGHLLLQIIGDGPQQPTLETLARREGVGSAVHFTGWVENRQVHELLRRSHVFAFPSIRDFGGGVVLEAMALGLVPIVVAFGGPGELVSPSTGLAVPIGGRDAIVRDLRAALERLVSEPELVPVTGRRARDRVESRFTWPVKAGQVLEVYRFALGLRDRPDFGMPFPDLIATSR